MALLLSGLALAACNSDPPELTPPGRDEDFLRAADILAATQCELDRAAQRSAPGFAAKKAEIAMTLTVQVSESTGGGITLTIPIASTDLTIRRDRVPAGAALRKMDFRFVHEIGTAPTCPTEAMPETPEGLRYVAGGLGLAEWLAETDTLVRHAGHAPREINYAMSFDVTLSDDRSPVFSRPIDQVDGSLSRQDATAREIRHRVAVTITPNAPAGRTADRARQEAADRFLDRIGG